MKNKSTVLGVVALASIVLLALSFAFAWPAPITIVLGILMIIAIVAYLAAWRNRTPN
ncbi:hypothetical protein [Haematomicrobium sanguinis]|uniref:hypothetical protein n=1 Tax=Haematomicrobium sanguinis TaxID=479106 RepID=UPI000A74B6EC|nr:hypothetical protein [Haematomicrobium sanguinis]